MSGDVLYRHGMYCDGYDEDNRVKDEYDKAVLSEIVRNELNSEFVRRTALDEEWGINDNLVHEDDYGLEYIRGYMNG